MNNTPNKFIHTWNIYRQKGLRGVLSGVLFRTGQTLLQSSARLAPTIKLSPAEQQLIARNAAFRNHHAGKRCFVIGNGPSLNTQDLSLLKDDITFVMSGFWKHPVVAQWQPHFYCLCDPLFFDNSPPMNRFFVSLVKAIHSTTYFLPLQAAEVIQNDRVLPLDRTFFLAFRGNLHEEELTQLDFTKFVPGAQSVSQLAIMAAIYMGCSPIYLLGLDHDWLAHRGMDRHFYSGKTVDNHPLAHNDLSRYSYKTELQSELRLWNGYETLQNLARKHSIQILNATNGGFLDVFPRVEYPRVVLA